MKQLENMIDLLRGTRTNIYVIFDDHQRDVLLKMNCCQGVNKM